MSALVQQMFQCCINLKWREEGSKEEGKSKKSLRNACTSSSASSLIFFSATKWLAVPFTSALYTVPYVPSPIFSVLMYFSIIYIIQTDWWQFKMQVYRWKGNQSRAWRLRTRPQKKAIHGPSGPAQFVLEGENSPYARVYARPQAGLGIEGKGNTTY